MNETRTPEPHRDREQPGDSDDSPADSAHPPEAEVDEADAQHDPKHAADGPSMISKNLSMTFLYWR